ncbi:core structural protein [Cotia virus SPAn232]|uniref:25 kDa core protein OPG138 n=2 Tax=Cotia virus TaxID=39444 RepID=A0A097IVX8_9POXV|nr:core structural protein [Cotia virus SPAn232]ADT91131.1 core structural protein [Cotia virus SPAn232]AIT70735.1 core structural protein [Cotia virus]
MADKKLARSSYDDYFETLNKLTPQLRTILAHISGEESNNNSRSNLVKPTENECVGGACPKPKCKKQTKSCGNPGRRKNVLNNNAEDLKIMQAVTNSGKIVYGTVKEGKLDVKGTVGEINQDLLGIESVNGGRKKRSSRSKKNSNTTIFKVDDGMD